ncbi:MAG: 2-dehydro-3-deoxyphosphogalactonate aldolase [Alphaproteobacteria bacterium]|jgi:2-dehydro-3-deoxyphosphogalactonate aldolase
MNNFARIDSALKQTPLIAILRGIKPDEVVSVGEVLVDAGITVLEVPLNSPNAFDSIYKLRRHLPASVLVGGGTVLQQSEVEKLNACGAEFIVSPNTKPSVIENALQQNMVPIPGFYTPTEALLAIDCGATYLKLFPANSHHDNFISGLKSVLPSHCKLLAVGGMNAQNSQRFMQLGFHGLGIGTSLYCSGMALPDIHQRAKAFVALCKTF